MTTQLLINLALPNKHNRVVRIMMLVTNYTIEKIRQHQVQQSVQRQNLEGNRLLLFCFYEEHKLFFMLKSTRETNLKSSKKFRRRKRKLWTYRS